MAVAKTGKWLLLTLVVLASGGGALAYFGLIPNPSPAAQQAEVPAAPRRPEARPVAVTVEDAAARPVQRKVSIVGSLYGSEELTVTPKVEGRIVRIHHDVGDVVRSGATLLEIDDTDYKLAVTEAQRALELELAKLGLKEMPPKDFDVRGLPAVVRAAALERNANTKLDRAGRLLGAMATEDREQLQTDLRVAQANHRQTILEAEATLAAVRHKLAQVEMARQKLADTKV